MALSFGLKTVISSLWMILLMGELLGMVGVLSKGSVPEPLG